MAQSRRDPVLGLGSLSIVVVILHAVVLFGLLLSRIWTAGLMARSPAGRARPSARHSAFLSLQFFPELLAAPSGPAPPPNPRLTALLDELARAVPQERGAVPPGMRVQPPPGFAIEAMTKSVRDAAHGRLLRINQNAEVQVYIHAAEVTDDNLRELRAAGAAIEITDAKRSIVQARVPVSRLEAVADLPFVQLVRLPSYAIHHTGSVDTEGDAIVLANQVRSQLGVTGKGVRVGVISDGIKGIFAANCTTCGPAASSPINTGDLPNATGTRDSSGHLISVSDGITAKSFIAPPLQDLEGQDVLPSPCGFAGAGAEGTALLEIIHDLAPEARLFFANADTDLAFNQAVNYLAANTDVAMDDLGFFGLPFDGTSDVSSNTAAALNSATNPIRAYFTAVGNEAKVHYLGAYVDSGVDGGTIAQPAGHLHQFQGVPGVTTDVLNLGPQPYDPIELPTNGEVVVVLEWDDPFGASSNDYDLFLVEESTGTVVARSTNRGCAFATRLDPVECLDYTYTGASPSPATFHIVIQNPGNTAAVKNLNLFFFEPECAKAGPISLAATHEKHNYNTPRSSVPAESDAGGSPVSVTSVGALCSASFNAALVNPSGCSDTTHSTIEFFSSNGPTVDGRTKPDVSGIDGVSVTGAGSFENPFFGSSAATPHAAGVAALLLEAAPCLLSGAMGARDHVTARTTLRDLILNNAAPLGSPAPNNIFGSGRINALAAAEKTLPSANGTTSETVSGNTPTGASVPLSGFGISDPDQCPLTFEWTGGCGTGSGTTITCPFGANTVNLTASNNGVTMSPSVSATITVTNFAVSVSPASATAKAGQSATYTVSVAPQNGPFGNAVSLACSGLPSLASCSFSKPSVTPGSGTATSTLTLSTTAGSAGLAPPAGGGQLPAFAVWLRLSGVALAGTALLTFATRRERRRRLAPAFGLALAVVVAAVHLACGGGGSQSPPPNPGTPQGTYTITVSGTSGSLVQSASAALTVN
jgi:hypothetical protein